MRNNIVIIILASSLTILGLVGLMPESNREILSSSVTIVASIIAAGSVVIALLRYLGDKKRENNLYVLEQLDFFRTSVLRANEKVVTAILQKNQDHNFFNHRVGIISDFRYAWLYKKFKKEVDIQTALDSDPVIHRDTIKMLNSMEQFSWSVILHGTFDNHVLAVVHDTFVETVEQFAHQILFMRADHPNHYEGIKFLYERWAPAVDRSSFDQKLDRILGEAKHL